MDTKILLTPEESAQRASVGRTTIYALIASGELESVRIGRSRRVPAQALEEYVARLRNGGNVA
jgi:excisionase family DNA binding protein